MVIYVTSIRAVYLLVYSSRQKQKLRNRNPHGGWQLEDLKEAMRDIWNNEISVSLISRFIDSIPERLEKVRVRKGGPSGY